MNWGDTKLFISLLMVLWNVRDTLDAGNRLWPFNAAVAAALLAGVALELT